MSKSQHYWRIHARVTRRLWSDLSPGQRDVIAADAKHGTELFKWFAKKVNDDAQRIYEDPTNWDNDPWTFRHNTRRVKVA